MENSSLNASHRYARQANKCFRSAKFDEAILNHGLARQKIEECMSTATDSIKVLESLRLQKEFHTKQMALIAIRRDQHEKCLAAQAAVDLGQVFRNNMEDSRQVQVELYRSLDDVEKVVEVLEQKTLGGGGSGTRDASEFLAKLFEDLKLLNQQSMVLVNRLVTQLDARMAENEELREQHRTTTSDRDQPRTSSLEKKNKTPLSDSDPELHRLEELAPLELPSFDFNTFSSSVAVVPGEGVEGVEVTESTNLRRIGFGSIEGAEEG